jgi:hypothetical protein
MMNYLLLQLYFIIRTIPPEYKEHLSEAALQQEAMQPCSQPTGFCTHHAPIVTVLARC